MDNLNAERMLGKPHSALWTCMCNDLGTGGAVNMWDASVLPHRVSSLAAASALSFC